jgi:hypothetical protein
MVTNNSWIKIQAVILLDLFTTGDEHRFTISTFPSLFSLLLLPLLMLLLGVVVALE